MRAVTLLVVSPPLGIRQATRRLAAVGLRVSAPAFPSLAVVPPRVVPLLAVRLAVAMRIERLGRRPGRPASVAVPRAWHTLVPGLALITFRIMGPFRAGASGHRSRHVGVPPA